MKKAMKIVLFLLVVLLVLGIAAFYYIKSMLPSGDGNNDIVEGYYKKFQSDAPLEMKYSQLGPYETACTEFASDHESIGKILVWYPKDLEADNQAWPLIMVVNASGTPASSYEPFFPRLASWGFIVVGNEDGQTGNGETASLTLDFMLNVPADSVFAGKIDYDSIGNDVPKVRARAVGAEHEQMLMRSDGYMTA